jgi:DNA-binding GntR family transcriptional regulator
MMKTTNLDAWVALNDKFHQAIYAPSQWTRLLGVIGTLRNLTAPYVRQYISHSWDRCAANAEHAEIVRAVEARDASKTRTALKKHLWHTCEGIISCLNKTNGKEVLDQAS